MNEIERGDRAREVLENTVYQDAFKAIEQELIRLWQTSPNAADRQDLWLEQKLLSKVQTYLENTMANGKLARSRPTVASRTMDLVRTAASGMR